MKLTLRQYRLILVLLIIHFCFYFIPETTKAAEKLNSKELICQHFPVNLQLKIPQKSQLNEIDYKNPGLEKKKRKISARKKSTKQVNPSKLRYMPRKTKPKINRKNGVNRYYAIYYQY